MARIKELNFELKGNKYSVAVKCSSKGEFSCELLPEIYTTLKLPVKLTSSSLNELTVKFYDALNRYKTAGTKQELFIAICYRASGTYTVDKKRMPLFTSQSPYYMDSFYAKIDVLGFGFEVVIKETVDGVVQWYRTYVPKRGNTILNPEESLKEFAAEDYVKAGLFYDKRHKKIPFSIEALRTLNVAQEKIRHASELLFHFIEQDEKGIELTLKNQKLLS